MKKLVLLFSGLIVILSGGYSQIIYQNDFEQYASGNYLAQSDPQNWITWSNQPGTPEDALISATHALSGTQSVKIDGVSDVLLLLGDKTSGKYLLDFYLYIPSGYIGYYNLFQLINGANSKWGAHVFFYSGGSGYVYAGGANSPNFSFSYNSWIHVKNIIDLDSDQAQIFIDENLVYQWQWSLGSGGGNNLNQLAALDMYAWNTNGTPLYYFDDISYVEIGEPHITINPESHYFGIVPMYHVAHQAFTLTNDGGAIAEGDINIINTNPFWLEGSTGTGEFILQPGESTQIMVYYIPSEFGPDMASLVIDSDEPGNDLTVPLSGEAMRLTGVVTFVNPSEGGSTTGQGQYWTYETFCLNVIPNPGYVFDYWGDLGGNFISSDPEYCSEIPPTWYYLTFVAFFKSINFQLDLNAYFEGPFISGEGLMSTSLNPNKLPLSQPYNSPPWNYTGDESVGAIPNADIVDWILVEMRETAGDASTATADKAIAKKAGFILKNGKIVGLDGTSNLDFDLVINDNLYAVIWHRNHLGIMSSNPLVRTNDIYSYDFTTSYLQIYGGTYGSKELSPGSWGMIAGDGNADGQINLSDKTNIWIPEAGRNDYLPGDYNLEGEVNNKDKNDACINNLTKSSQVPGGAGFLCGENFIDSRDGKSYTTVQIGDQCWMSENLNYATGLSRCYDDIEENCDTYGRLYRSQSANVCPEGWHLPSSGEFSDLTNFLGGVSVAGGKMKTTGTFQSGTGLWYAPNTGATNESGFSALPAGVHIMWTMPPNYNSMHEHTNFWSSTTNEYGDRYSISLSYSNSQIISFYAYEPDSWSVRCIKNEPINWSCNDTLIDGRDGQSYPTIQIGSQCWMAENINIGAQINASINMSNDSQIEKYCYENNLNNCDEYGGLYQWNEMMNYSTTEGSQGICPEGWHIPTIGQWGTLVEYLGGYFLAGPKLKETGTQHWNPPNSNATNESGFTALPGGLVWYSLVGFSSLGYEADFWSSTIGYGNIPKYEYISVVTDWEEGEFLLGLSVRCLSNSQTTNLPPIQPICQHPQNGAQNQSTSNTSISWYCNDPENDPLIYDIYFGTTNPPPIIITKQSATEYNPGILQPGTTYYWKIVAFDSYSNATEGAVWSLTTWQCGNSFIDSRDGKSYNTVQIGTECWMAENLNIGTQISGSIDMSNDSQIEKYCYDDNMDNCDEYGGLYQWDEMMDYTMLEGAQGICPAGWYIPAIGEFNALVSFLGGQILAPNKLKETGTVHWNPPNNATNESGFTALPGGSRWYYPIEWIGLGDEADFWSSTHSKFLFITPNYADWDEQDDVLGFSVRCLKN